MDAQVTVDDHDVLLEFSDSNTGKLHTLIALDPAQAITVAVSLSKAANIIIRAALREKHHASVQ